MYERHKVDLQELAPGSKKPYRVKLSLDKCPPYYRLVKKTFESEPRLLKSLILEAVVEQWRELGGHSNDVESPTI